MFRIGIDLDNTVFFCDSGVYRFVASLNFSTFRGALSYAEVDCNTARAVCPILKKAFKFLNPAAYMPDPHAIEVINSLRANGAEICFISSRPHIKPMIAHTTEWLQRNNVSCDRLILGCHNKAGFAKANHFDFLIDDQKSVCRASHRRGVHVIQFCGGGKKDDCSANFVVLSTWQEIERYILGGSASREKNEMQVRDGFEFGCEKV